MILKLLSLIISLRVLSPNRIFAALYGDVSEWLKEHAWKVCIRETVSRVRISPSPPSVAEATFGGQSPLKARRRLGKLIILSKVLTESSIAGKICYSYFPF